MITLKKLEEKPKVGGVTEPNVEAIIAAKPDLVIGGISMNHNIVESFALDLPIIQNRAKKVDDILNNIIQIGIHNRYAKEEAEELVEQMKEDIDKGKDKSCCNG